jgi:copper chaperone
MNTLKFKTNVKCGGCIATVTPHLNQAKGIISWNVDTNNPDKILSVESENVAPEEITAILNGVGYQAELISFK